MFNTYIVEDNSAKAARITAAATDRLGQKLESISQAEIKSKDRVDITLEEYDTLRNELKRYKDRARRAESLLTRIRIPAEIIEKIDPDTVDLFTTDDPRWCRKGYRITFYVEDYR
jgi:hypothetical protein